MTASVQVAGGWGSTREAEHVFAAHDGPVGAPAYVGTTFDPVLRVVVHAAEDASDLPCGTRLFVFPGHEAMVGTMTVGDVLLLSAIDQVRGLGGSVPSLDDRLDTQEFVRPVVVDGRVVLVVRPGHRTGLVPFEQPNPTPCCADHP